MLGEMQERKMKQQLQLEAQRRLNFKIFKNHGFDRMTKQKKEIFLQTLFKMTNYSKLIKYQHGKREVHSLIKVFKIKNHAGIAIRFIK
jgi:hypothetical protein